MNIKTGETYLIIKDWPGPYGNRELAKGKIVTVHKVSDSQIWHTVGNEVLWTAAYIFVECTKKISSKFIKRIITTKEKGR